MPPPEITLKKSRSLYLVLALGFTGTLLYICLGAYNKTRIIFTINPYVSAILILLFVGSTISSWYNFLNPTSKITFNTEGIIYDKKLIAWQEIKSFRTKYYATDTIDSLNLVITLYDSRKKTISLFALATDEQQIRACITAYTSHSIQDEGHFN
ncbi:hypothetical protein SAMN05444266_10585 [Chitinophaga jiangningensis]|uniref:PH domain-containing protein n=1 Tax=Chitinophaga jiangningensis TaxID=1419482 RepID=A0A1M7DQ51_9BACT|nr:hypothetical protein [Chitinophaga jiangningensis]SHL81528.1 hypothetical protein SAMN05444266_10585 [Chitinophaga jiangningensis]